MVHIAGIDLHAHLAPVLDDASPPAGVAALPDGRLALDGAPAGLPDLYRPQRLLTYLDAAALDAAVVTIPPPFYRQALDADAAATWVRAANDGILAAIEIDRTRLSALAYLPLEHPAIALAEYERVRGGAHVGVTGAAGGRSASLADPALEPLWRALAADGRMLLLHPGASPDARLDPYYLSNLLGNPLETALAAAQLVFGEVLVRHPALRVLLVHAGGCVPAVAGRWERGAATGRPGLPALREAPATTLRRLWVDCVAHDPALIDLALATFGEQRLVLGSDWPFPMGTQDPHSQIAHRDAALRRRIATDNARALLDG